MRYIKDLEAVGFQPNQAEAQVKMAQDMVSNLATKDDFAGLKSDVAVLKQDVAVLKDDVAELKQDFRVFKTEMKGEFALFREQMQNQLKEWEFRITIRLGILTVSTLSVGVAILGLLIRI
jgi:hypothetical protein